MMRKNSPRSSPAVLILLLATLVVAQRGFGQCVSLTAMGAAYTQNFDALANSGTTNALAIEGWALTESGGSARDNGQYGADTGESNAGDIYSYGAAGSTERALGTLRSGTLIPTIGACFTNNTGGSIGSLTVTYTGEEWRLGTAARTDQLNFEYSTSATSLTTGTWTGVAALNFVTPDTSGAAGARNGNVAPFRTVLGSTITVSIANGATVWIRWTDIDASGADDGLAVDDFSLTPLATGGTGSPLTFLPIFEINGPGTASPLAGRSVSTRGVVTALRASTGSVRGFYIESPAADRDTDPNTSEGLLVFTGSTAAPACAVVGNYIQIEGTVSNFVTSTAPAGSLPLTELVNQANCQVLATNQLGNLPAAVTIDAANPLMVGGSAALSREWMGMRVSVPNATVVGASLGNLTESSAQASPSGEFFVTVPGVTRPLRGAGILDTRRPSAAAATVPVWNGNPESLRVNVTGLSPAGTPYEVAAGSTVTGLSGVMDYSTSAGQFQLYTNSTGAGTPSPATPSLSATPVPVALASDLTIGCFNMERFYNDRAENNGAVTLTPAAYQGRLNKASLAIRNVMRMPDIIGLEEIEGQRNTPGSQAVTVIQDIVDKVNADAVSAGQGNPNYNYCIGLTNDPGAITLAIVYKREKVRIAECLQYGLNTEYIQPAVGANILNDRPPVTILANVTAAGSDSSMPVRLVVNHLRSLSGIDEPGATNGDRVRTKRNAQAKYLANLINGSSGDQAANWNTVDNLVVVGDFNAFNVNDGYADVMNCIAGNPAPANRQYFTAAQLAVDSPCTAILNPPLNLLTTLNPAILYSYSFSGTIQTLDHVLLNSKAYNRFRQIVYARNDADFPDGPTYRNNFNRPERVTDHDMPVVYLRLPVEVTSRTRLNTSAVSNRVAARYTRKISVTNTGGTTLSGPVYVFFSTLTAGVTLPGLPTYNGQPYATIDLGAGLAPGATSGTVTIRFANPSNARIGRATTRFDGSF